MVRTCHCRHWLRAPATTSGHTGGMSPQRPGGSRSPTGRHRPKGSNRWRRAGVTTSLLAALLALVACNAPDAANERAEPLQLDFEVLAELPADPMSFTQGLEFTPDGRLFESSGGYGTSTLTERDPATGRIINRTDINPDWFAEGITVADTAGGPTIVMLTWREGIAVSFDPDTLQPTRQFTYEGEGWGICELRNGTLAMSDGSATLWFRDTDTFEVTGTVEVTNRNKPVDRLNELECVDGLVWANVWKTDTIVVINPTTGDVVAELDASSLVNRITDPDADVLNGIALRPGTTDEFIVAGKLWPSSWLIRVSPLPSAGTAHHSG